MYGFCLSSSRGRNRSTSVPDKPGRESGTFPVVAPTMGTYKWPENVQRLTWGLGTSAPAGMPRTARGAGRAQTTDIVTIMSDVPGLAAGPNGAVPDPAPWVHVSGERAAHPHAPGAPMGGYKYSPREGYSDYPDRYISTRSAQAPHRADNGSPQ